MFSIWVFWVYLEAGSAIESIWGVAETGGALSYLCVSDDAIDVYAGRQDLVSVRSKFGSAGPGLAVTDLSLPHPPRRARSA
jgi:hypothetical protein